MYLDAKSFVETHLQDILELKSKNYTLTSICREYGVEVFYNSIKKIIRDMGYGFSRKRNKFTQEEVEDIINRYLLGESSCGLAKFHDCTDDYILSVLRVNNIPVRTIEDIPEDILQKISNDYSKGVSLTSLSEKYNFSRGRIRRRLVGSGVEILKGSDASFSFGRHTINRDSFIDISEEKSAYFYGLILSDGCLSSDERYVSLEIKRDDEYILHELKRYLQTGAEVSHCSHLDKRTGKTLLSSKLSFGDKVVVQRLIDLGLTPRKSLKEKCPDILKFNRHFWRGFLDGDGSIYRGKVPRIEIHGGYEITKSFQEYCEHLGVTSSIGHQQNKNSKIYTCRVNGLGRSKIVADILYDKCSIYLPRKYQTYLDRYVNYVY